MTDKIAVMLCGPDGADTNAADEFDALAAALKHRLPNCDVESGFSGSGPAVRAGLDDLAARGAGKIVCIPGTLFGDGQAMAGLSAECDRFAGAHGGVDLIIARELAMDSKLLAAASDRIEQAEAQAPGNMPREDTLLMVVGPGSDDRAVNANVAKVARLLWEGMGFGWAEVSYADTAFPAVDEGFEKALKMGHKRIIVFPYMMFAGDALRRAYAAADACAAAQPDVEILKAGYLNDRARLADSLADRIDEALNGTGNMNCQVCTYREQIIGTGDDHHHGHDHGHDHHHHHHHDHGHDHHHGHDHDHGHKHGHRHDHDHGGGTGDA